MTGITISLIANAGKKHHPGAKHTGQNIYRQVHPPSTVITAPFTYFDSSDVRYSAALAMSSALPISGAIPRSFLTFPNPTILGIPMDFDISVLIPPGAMLLHLIFWLISWNVTFLDTAATAALEAAYAAPAVL